MGVLNVTPDSFSDGGLYMGAEAAVGHARRLVEEGAQIVDVGGESTRPGAEPVPLAEELRRTLPVIEALAAAGLPADHDAAAVAAAATATVVAAAAATTTAGRPAGPAGVVISIDTSKAAVAQAALVAGASFVNDVSALRADPEMAGVVADSQAECCLMHMRGEPRTMQDAPRYGDVVDDVRSFLEERLAHAVGQGIAEQRIVLDPGIGFGKTVAHNLQLLARLDELAALGRPVLVGTSRKSFLGRVIARARAGVEAGAGVETRAGVEMGAGVKMGSGMKARAGVEMGAGAGVAAAGQEPVAPDERLAGTIATNVLAYERGARLFRVHEVAPVRDALALTTATLDARWSLTTRTTASG